MKARPAQIKEVNRPLRSSKVESTMKNPTVVMNGDKHFGDQFPEITILKKSKSTEPNDTSVSKPLPNQVEQSDSAKNQSSNSKEAVRQLRSAMKSEESITNHVNGEKKTSEVNNVTSDLSILKKSMVTSITGPQDIIKAIESGTSEVSELLNSECFIIYECKVCRNLFRSVANFITHKRSYCVDKFSSTEQSNGIGEHAMALGGMKGIITAGRKTARRDILSLLERCKKGVHAFDGPLLDNELVAVSPGMSNPALPSSGKTEEMPPIQILGSEGRVIGWRRSATTVACRTCTTEFSDCTQLDAHAEKCVGQSNGKTSFGCPCCPKFFSSSWSVYRHLRRYHGKNNDQVLQLRGLITKQGPSVAEKKIKKPVTADTKTNDKAWIDQLFTDTMGSKQCYICGRQFERKAALASHLAACKRKRAGGKPSQSTSAPNSTFNSPTSNHEAPAESRNGPVNGHVSPLRKSEVQEVMNSQVIADDVVILEEDEYKDCDTSELVSDGDYLPRSPVIGEPNGYTLSPVPMEDDPVSLPEDVLNEIHLRENLEVSFKDCRPSDEETQSPSSASSLSSASPAEDSDLEEGAGALLPYISRDHGCRLCGRSSGSRSQALQHVAAHLGAARFRCAVASCSFQAYSKNDVHNHILVYHKINKAYMFVAPIPKEEMFSREDSSDFLGFEGTSEFCPSPLFRQYASYTPDSSNLESKPTQG